MPGQGRDCSKHDVLWEDLEWMTTSPGVRGPASVPWKKQNELRLLGQIELIK